MRLPIRRALVSVYDKTRLAELGLALAGAGALFAKRKLDEVESESPAAKRVEIAAEPERKRKLEGADDQSPAAKRIAS